MANSDHKIVMLPIKSIRLCGRIRKDLGDIDGLAESISKLGLLQPIVATEGNVLIAGERRLAACKKLKWQEVPVVVPHIGWSLVQMLESERDENTCRKDFTPSESVAMGLRLEEVYRRDNEQKRAAAAVRGGQTAGRGRPKDDSLTESCGKAKDKGRHSRETTSQVASAIGMSGRQYEKAKAVVKSGNEQAIAQMDSTGKVDPAFRAIERDKKKQLLRKKAAQAPSVEKPDWHIKLGCCLEHLPNISGARLIFADPPYNIGIDYGDGVDADRMAGEEYIDWFNKWISLCVRSLTPDGSLWVMINDEWAEHYAIALNAHGHRRAWIKWYETFGVNCVNNFNRCSRHVFHYVRHPKNFVFNAESQHIRRPSDRQLKYGDKRADPDGKLLDDVWTIPRLVENCEERMPDFPTQVPLMLMRRIIACASDPADLVVDPFCGSGSTGAAALQLGRRFIGIERGERFCDLATVRLAGVTPFAPDAR